MAHILIAAHGKLAEALVDSARIICGEELTKNIDCLNMTEGKSVQQFCDEARAILIRHPNDDYLILVDLFGASPCNNCLSVYREASYRVITGANLPMLLELIGQNNGQSLPDLWQSMVDSGKDSIRGVYIPTH